ncbi:MAG: hypothetical protein IPP25_19765 [Saprospiraceae bacterium]|nr:hypothetical protein [Candidatus Opimibacter skivensis]
MDNLLPRTGWGLKATLLTILLSACLSSWVSATNSHDIHVSVCELRWNEESGAFEVSVKIFIDDLERALTMEGAPGLFIGTPKESEEAETDISHPTCRNILQLMWMAPGLFLVSWAKKYRMIYLPSGVMWNSRQR